MIRFRHTMVNAFDVLSTTSTKYLPVKASLETQQERRERPIRTLVPTLHHSAARSA